MSWLNSQISFNKPDLLHHQLSDTFHLTLKITYTLDGETRDTDNCPFQNCSHDYTSNNFIPASFPVSVAIVKFTGKKSYRLFIINDFIRDGIYIYICIN